MISHAVSALFGVLLALMILKLLWNVGLPFALCFKPDWVLSTNQQNISLGTGFELVGLVLASLTSAFLDCKLLLCAPWFVFASGLAGIAISYLPLVAYF